MFRSIDLNLNAGPIKNAFLRLVRQIQTEVEHKRITNDTDTDMVKGDIVYMTEGDRQAKLADAAAAASAQWAAVVAEPIVAGGRGVARTDGYALVRFETGLGDIGNNNEGQQVFLSELESGAASTELPKIGNTSIVGILADATNYTDLNPFCWVVLGHCCIPYPSVFAPPNL